MARVTLRDDGGWTDRTAEGDPLDRVRAALARGERRVTIPRGRYYVSPKDFAVARSDDFPGDGRSPVGERASCPFSAGQGAATTPNGRDARSPMNVRPPASAACGDVYLKLRGVKDFEIDFGDVGCTDLTLRDNVIAPLPDGRDIVLRNCERVHRVCVLLL